MSTHCFPLILRTTSGWQLVDVRSILHIAAEDKYARISFADGTECVVFHSLHDLEERLACGERIGELLFLRTHRSCIVAMHHATALHGKQFIELSTGVRMPIGKRSWQQLLDALGGVRGAAQPLGSSQ